jgi:hypothetical protein
MEELLSSREGVVCSDWRCVLHSKRPWADPLPVSGQLGIEASSIQPDALEVPDM